MKARRHKPHEHAKEAFKEELARWAKRIGVNPGRVQVQRMTMKWASCSPSGRLCFAADLLDQPAAFREAVIVHELLHLVVPNHGRLFRSLMSAYMPGQGVANTTSRRSLCGNRIESAEHLKVLDGQAAVHEHMP